MSLSSGVLMLESDSHAASPANTSELSQTRIRAGKRVVQKKRVLHELAKHEASTPRQENVLWKVDAAQLSS